MIEYTVMGIALYTYVGARSGHSHVTSVVTSLCFVSVWPRNVDKLQDPSLSVCLSVTL